MIKARATQENGRALIVLGLSYENIKRLQRDDPIMFDATELGYEGTDIMVLAGATEKAITDKLNVKKTK